MLKFCASVNLLWFVLSNLKILKFLNIFFWLNQNWKLWLAFRISWKLEDFFSVASPGNIRPEGEQERAKRMCALSP